MKKEEVLTILLDKIADSSREMGELVRDCAEGVSEAELSNNLASACTKVELLRVLLASASLVSNIGNCPRCNYPDERRY